MTTTLSEGVIVPDVGDVNWAGKLEVNWNLLNGALANLSGNVKLDRDNTWTGEQSFTLPIVGSITGTASKAIADEDGNNIKSTYGKLSGNQTWSGINTYNDGIYTKTGFRAINDSYSSGTPSANIFYSALAYGGLVSNTFTRSFSIDGAIRTTGYNDLSLRVYSQTGEVLSGVLIESNATASDIAFRPLINGTHKLGSSSYQWSSVYAQSYYYNGTQWGLDRANTWTALNSYNQSIQITGNFNIGTTPSSDVSGGFNFGNGTSNIGNITSRVNSSGATYSRLYISNKFANGALDPNGTWKSVELQVGLRANGDRFIYTDARWRNSLTPYDSTLSLGNSTDQWNNLYAQNYYYNGTAWGLDKANVWTEANTFTSVLRQKINSVYSQIPATDRFAVHEFIGTDDNRIFTVNCADRSSGQREMSLIVYDTDGTFKASGIFRESDNSFSFRARSNNEINLGTSTNKWKTLNGINPGALSFPNLDAAVGIDTTGWNVAGSLSNTYTPAVDGWLAIDIKDTATNSVFIYAKGLSGTKQYSASVYGNGSQGTGRLSLMMPAFANVQYAFIIKADSLSDISYARFYPCLGNV